MPCITMAVDAHTQIKFLIHITLPMTEYYMSGQKINNTVADYFLMASITGLTYVSRVDGGLRIIFGFHLMFTMTIITFWQGFVGNANK